MISSRNLEIFIAVYEEQSMTLAAKKLTMTQPAVSQAVKDIEKDYGVTLFERIGHKIFPTETAHIIYDYGRRIMNLYSDLDESVKKNEGITQVRVGGNISVGTAQIIPMIERFNEKYKDIKVKVMIYTAPVIIAALDNNELDIGLIEDQTDKGMLGNYIVEPYYDDRIVVVASNEHPFAGRSVTLNDLCKEKFLFREKGSGVRVMFDSILKLNNMSVDIIWECTSTDAIVSAVKKNMGISVVPYLLVKDSLDRGEVTEVKIEGVNLTRKLNIVYHKDKVISQPVQAFIDIARKIGKTE